jgi:hypothetical protein
MTSPDVFPTGLCASRIVHPPHPPGHDSRLNISISSIRKPSISLQVRQKIIIIITISRYRIDREPVLRPPLLPTASAPQVEKKVPIQFTPAHPLSLKLNELPHNLHRAQTSAHPRYERGKEQAVQFRFFFLPPYRAAGTGVATRPGISVRGPNYWCPVLAHCVT